MNNSHEQGGSESLPEINWAQDDPSNPQNFHYVRKWTITAISALACLAVSFASSAYTADLGDLTREFSISNELALLGVSLFVLGFAIGPVIWAPLSETIGRRNCFLLSALFLTAFQVGGACSRHFYQLVIFRALGGALGSAPLTNAGGVIADLYSAEQRGLAVGFYACAPFLGPVLGPIAGGFLGESQGWRWVEWMLAIFAGVVGITGFVLVPETNAPVLLRRRAGALLKARGLTPNPTRLPDVEEKGLGRRMFISLSRPWVLLFREPIVIVLAFYNSIIYGTTYLILAAFPIVFTETRGWSAGFTGLAFLGITVGMGFATIFMILINRQYIRQVNQSSSHTLQPEARLRSAMVGGIVLPIGLFWFAWTNSPSIHWIVCLIGSSGFGFGNITISLALSNYLIDTYTKYAASALAATIFMRSVVAAILPLFTEKMYHKLGIHWASSIPAFLALLCAPVPFCLFHYGLWIRRKSRYAEGCPKV